MPYAVFTSLLLSAVVPIASAPKASNTRDAIAPTLISSRQSSVSYLSSCIRLMSVNLPLSSSISPSV